MITPEPARARNRPRRRDVERSTMEASMTAKVVSSLAASSLALVTALVAGGASAQTVITRSITTEPVETVITQTPAGTVVTRRPVDAPLPPAMGPTIVQPGLPAVTVAETVPDTVDAITT